MQEHGPTYIRYIYIEKEGACIEHEATTYITKGERVWKKSQHVLKERTCIEKGAIMSRKRAIMFRKRRYRHKSEHV